MAEQTQPYSPGAADVLQRTLEDGLSRIPAIFIDHQVVKKLKAQGVELPKRVSAQLTEHILSGNNQPFVYGRGKKNPRIRLTFDSQDIQEVIQNIERFQQEQLPQLIPRFALKISKNTLKTLKASWPKENELQEADVSEFRKRMELRWGKPLGQLRMLLTMVREWCRKISIRESRRKGKKRQFKKLLIRLLTRGCQVTDEILCLLENGFADGAMARWRTLHEIAVVAAIIRIHGEEIADRYRDHQHVESKRAMDKYIVTSARLGYRPISDRAKAKIQLAYDNVMAKYGKSFRMDYGWAAFHLKKERPTFADLESAAGRAHMRSHYQMGNDNVHAGIKSMYVRLGLLGDYSGLLAGRSNAGLTEPGQNTAHTLTQLALLVCFSEPILDDYVIAEMLTPLRDDIPSSFARVDTQLRREDRAIRVSAAKRRRKKC